MKIIDFNLNERARERKREKMLFLQSSVSCSFLLHLPDHLRNFLFVNCNSPFVTLRLKNKIEKLLFKQRLCIRAPNAFKRRMLCIQHQILRCMSIRKTDLFRCSSIFFFGTFQNCTKTSFKS